jgi:signal transduction histidine kinase
MVIESLLHSTFFLLYLALAVYILRKNPGENLNRAIFLLMIVSALQSLALMIVRYPLTPRVAANVFMDIQSILLTSYAPIIFLSLIYFTRIFKPGIITYPLITLYVLSFTIFQLTTDFASVQEKNEAGIWIMDFNNQTVLTTLDIIHNGLLISGFILLFIFFKKTKDELRRKQAKIILITASTSYILSLTNVILSYFFKEVRLLMLNDLFTSIFLAGFIYAIVKYELFEITPSMVVEQIIHNLPIGLIIADSQSIITRTNNSLHTITNKNERFFQNKNLWMVLSEIIGEENTQAIINKGKFEKVALISEDKTNKTVDIFNKELFDRFDRIIGSITLVHDIDKLIQTQNLLAQNNQLLEKRVLERTHELKLSKEKAEQSNILISEFLHNMSHEVRTPMNGIIGFSRMLFKPDISKEKLTNYAKIIQSNSEQLLKIIEDILEISRLESHLETPKETVFCLNSLITEIYEKFKEKKARQKVAVYLKKPLSDTDSYIKSDKSKIKRILNNLLENAYCFTLEGSIELGYESANNKLTIYVKDTGIGIAKKNQEVIFKRFSQEEKQIPYKKGGLGLGLSIARENAWLLNGNVKCISEKGKGSTFYLTIPYQPAE